MEPALCTDKTSNTGNAHKGLFCIPSNFLPLPCLPSAQHPAPEMEFHALPVPAPYICQACLFPWNRIGQDSYYWGVVNAYRARIKDSLCKNAGYASEGMRASVASAHKRSKMQKASVAMLLCRQDASKPKAHPYKETEKHASEASMQEKGMQKDSVHEIYTEDTCIPLCNKKYAQGYWNRNPVHMVQGKEPRGEGIPCCARA